MTIAQLRKMYPHSYFAFFENGKETRKVPFYHAPVKSYEEHGDWLFIEA